MALPVALAVGTFAMTALGTIAGLNQSRAQARAQAAYQEAVLRINAQHRDEVMRWQNETWKQDLDYAFEMLDYGKSEFARQAEWQERGRQAIRENQDFAAYTLMARAVEEDIAQVLFMDGLMRENRAREGAARAVVAERGVEGATIDAVLGEFQAQAAGAEAQADAQRDMRMRQIWREGLAVKAAGDQQLFELASGIRTLAPDAPIRTPGPVNPLQPAAPVAQPSPWMAAAQIGSAAMSSLRLYSDLSGTPLNQTVSNISSWVSRQFSL